MTKISRIQIQPHLPLLAILLFGTVLRFSGLDWGISSLRDFRVDGRELSIQQAGFHPDANFLTVATASLHRSIHPYVKQGGQEKLYSAYGPVFMYLFWIIGKIFSVIAGFDLFNLNSVRDVNWTHLAGRSLSALAGVLTILFTYRIGARCYGRPAGLIAAFLLAVTPLHVQSSHFNTVDVLVTLWMTMAFLAFLRVIEGGDVRDYAIAGGAIGLSCATKLHAIQLFVPLLAAHLIHGSRVADRGSNERQNKKKDKRKKQASAFRLLSSAVWFYILALFNRRLFIAMGASVVAFVLLAPSAVLRFHDYFDAENTWSAANAILINAGRVRERGSLHFIGTPRYLYFITNLFPVGMGIPLEVTIFAGIAWAVYRHRREDLLLLSFVVFYFLMTGSFQGKHIRYFVLWLPFVAVLSSRFLVELCGASRKAIRVAGITFASVVGLYSSAYAAAFVGIYRQPDVRVEAAKWVAANVPAGSVVLLERGHNSLRELLSKKDYNLRRLDIDKLLSQAIDIAEHIKHPVSPTENQLRANYYRSSLYDLYLQHVDHLVLSDDRLEARRRLPFAALYYNTLLDGGFGYTLVRQFTVTPTFLGIPFDDRGANVTWRQFDHPCIFVFQRTGESRTFDPNYRSILPLGSPRKAYDLVIYALAFNDILVLHGCLPKNVRETVNPEKLSDVMDKLRAQPDQQKRLSEPRFAVQEADGWAINVPMHLDF